ncbi:MAG: WG repeat-containing protein [Prevotella sp.]|nr:WG repeat-containing protein [Prevotella sp.]
MKRVFVLAILVMTTLAGMAQEKLFDQAIKNGRAQKQLYEIYNAKSKMIKPDKLTQVGRERGYILGGYTMKEVGRFGDVAETVERFFFIPKDQYGEYIFENISETTPYARLTAQGKVYFYRKPADNGEFFTPYSDAKWSGEVRNGLICGTGEGFKQIGDRIFVYFKGTFNEGLPTGEARFCTYDYGRMQEFIYNKSLCQQETSTTGKLSDGMCWIKGGEQKYGFVNAQGKTVIAPQFRAAKDFSNGIAYVTEGKTEVKINKTGKVVAISENATLTFDEMVTMKKNHPDLLASIEVLATKYANSGLNFDQLVSVEKEFPNLKATVLPHKTALYRKDCQELDSYYDKCVEACKAGQRDFSGRSKANSFRSLYGKYDFDPDGRLPKASRMIDYYTVCDATNVYVKGSYWDTSYSGEPSFDDSCYGDLSLLSSANSICDSGAETDFADFYASVKPTIASKRNNLSLTADRSRSEYNSAHNRYVEEKRRQEEAQREAKKRALDSVNASNIYQYVVREKDWSRGRFLDSDDDYDDHRDVYFKDLDHEGYEFSETIHEVYNREHNKHYYWVSTGLFSSSSHTTYADCLVAAFLNRYGRSWYENRY